MLLYYPLSLTRYWQCKSIGSYRRYRIASHRRSPNCMQECGRNIPRGRWWTKMGHRRRSTWTRSSQTAKRTQHFWQPSSMQLCFSFTPPTLATKTRSSPRRRLCRRQRAHWRNLLWWSQRRWWRWLCLRRWAIFSNGNWANYKVSRSSSTANESTEPCMEFRQSKCVGNE